MDTYALLEDERRRLADELDALSADEWGSPSLCRGWSAHHVAAHLTLPWAVGRVGFALGMARALGNIDRAMDDLTRDVARRTPPSACVASLRQHAGNRTTPPLFGPEAPLTDVVVHGADILQPLGRSVAVAPEALRRVLLFLASGARAPFGPRRLDGVTVTVTDLEPELVLGSGAGLVSGPGVAVACVLLRRDAHAAALSGPGVDRVLGRP